MPKPAQRRPKITNGDGRLTKGSVVSYEDLIVAQYLEEIKKSPPYTKKGAEIPPSPYAQKLTGTNIVPTPEQIRIQMQWAQGGSRPSSSRPASGRPVSGRPASGRPGSGRPPSAKKGRPVSAQYPLKSKHGSKPKINPIFIADPSLWDPATPRNEEPKRPRRERPESAPAKRNRPYSATSINGYGARPVSAKSGSGKIKALYKRQPFTIVATAFKNGTREVFAYVTAPTIKQLLELCTDKLGFTSAARRVFLDDGTEAFTPKMIPREAEIYISQGEPFKDPFRNVKQLSMLKKGASWTMNGVVFSQETKKTTKPALSKRFREQLEKKRRRILIFKNGIGHDGGYEIVADMDNTQFFLDACTGRLDMGCPARILYDWEGKEVTDLYETPVIDQCLQATSTPVLGPLWVSKGEGFSPKGPFDFISGLLHHIKLRNREAAHYEAQLNMAKDPEERDKVEIKAILSMNEKEIDEALRLVKNDVAELAEAREKLKHQKSKIKTQAAEEEDQGPSYKMTKTIKEVEFADRLVGVDGIKLKIYENGSYEDPEVIFFNRGETAKGAKGDMKRQLERLLDQLSCSRRLGNPKQPTLTALARKLFDKDGREVTDVSQLEDEQELWLSFGEGFRVPFTYVVQAVFDKIVGVNIDGSRNVAYKEQLLAEDTEGQSYYNWEATAGFPEEYDFKILNTDSNPVERDHIQNALETQEVSIDNHFLQNKDNSQFILYPGLIVETKKQWNDKSLWPPESQTFVLVRTAKDADTFYIRCKAFPQLALSTRGLKVEMKIPQGSNNAIAGYTVKLDKYTPGEALQMWQFTPEGQLANLGYAGHYLTNIECTGEESPLDTVEDIPAGEKAYFQLILCEPLKGKGAKNQRWAIKQERITSLEGKGEWIKSQVGNPEWNKKALSWPLTEEGKLNDDFDWPMEGFLVPGAPPLKKADRKQSGHVPIRLVVMKNGEKEMWKATPVVGPDLTNMMKDVNKTAMNGKRPHGDHPHHRHHKRKKSQKDDMKDSVDDDPSLHCSNLSLMQLEFQLFLERCTALLSLPFAARRLFDENGKEHTTLIDLKRDQLVYVSCGDAWNDPRLSKAEQQKRLLLANLTSDIAQIRQYCALRKPENLVLEVEGALVPNAKLVVNTCCLSQEEQADITNGETEKKRLILEQEQKEQEERQKQLEEILGDKSTAHERAHLKSDHRLDSLKWPWERIHMNGDFDEVIDANEGAPASKYSDMDMYNKFKPKPKSSPRHPGLHLQKFKYDSGYIVAVYNPNLVLGVLETEGRVAEVVLVKKKPDDISQRWVLRDDGSIQAKHNSQMVLSVSMPTGEKGPAEEAPITYMGCGATLQPKKPNSYGRANQRWRLDPDTGFIHAFHTDIVDMEITAANKANVCTYSIRHGEELDQPGYVVCMPTSQSQSEEVILCTSCARAMRGKQKLQRLPNKVDFACAMGSAKEKALQPMGSFQCLNGKVDLSTFEAEHTLEEWEMQLERLRQETSVRVIAREISAAQYVRPVKIYAYKNGEGRLKPGQLIVGSSIPGLLDQCTYRLQMTSASRRLYTADGMIVLDIDDLIGWAVDNYRNAIQQKNRDKKNGRLGPEGQNSKNGEEREKSVLSEHPSQQSGQSQGSGPTEVSKLMTKMHLNGDTPNGEDESSSSEDEGSTEQGSKKGQQRGTLARYNSLDTVQVPPLEYILRFPIEIWASAGGAFVKPDDAEEKYLTQIQNREERHKIQQELEKEKHILRQLQGRRLDELSPGVFKPTRSPRNPVLIEGHWQEPTYEEQKKHDSVHQLQTHLTEVKANQKQIKTKPVSVNTNRRLYSQPNVKRILVYPNGESMDRATYVWGENMPTILDNCTYRLNLMKAAKLLYTVTGEQITDFDQIQRDMILCVSTGRPFLKPRESNIGVEVKANWGRARKQYGPKATEITVLPEPNVNVDVDPFGPPELAIEGPKAMDIRQIQAEVQLDRSLQNGIH